MKVMDRSLLKPGDRTVALCGGDADGGLSVNKPVWEVSSFHRIEPRVVVMSACWCGRGRRRRLLQRSSRWSKTGMITYILSDVY